MQALHEQGLALIVAQERVQKMTHEMHAILGKPFSLHTICVSSYDAHSPVSHSRPALAQVIFTDRGEVTCCHLRCTACHYNVSTGHPGSRLVQHKSACAGECLQAVSSELSFFTLPNCFELFGFDLLLDEEWHLWLLEVRCPSYATEHS